MSQAILLVDLDHSLKRKHVLLLVIVWNLRLFLFLRKIDGNIFGYFLVSKCLLLLLDRAASR